jgi:hypothetical protein
LGQREGKLEGPASEHIILPPISTTDMIAKSLPASPEKVPKIPLMAHPIASIHKLPLLWIVTDK